MIDRYSKDSKIAKIFTDKSKYEYWFKVEEALMVPLLNAKYLSVCDWHDFNDITAPLPCEMKEKEDLLKHDVAAFVECLSDKVKNENTSNFIHYGVTSSDVVDTAMSLQIIDSCHIIKSNLLCLSELLYREALRYKDSLMVGRTHGMHASVITFGLKLAKWCSEIREISADFGRSVESLSGTCNMSGPVGNFSILTPDQVLPACKGLDLRLDLSATQIVNRSKYASVFSNLTILITVIEKIAVNLRNMSRTEIAEVSESFGSNQKGSSAMPHKKNPIGLENISGLSRLVRSNFRSILDNIVVWDERDISHSSVERVVIPDTLILSDYIVRRFISILDSLYVDTDKMSRNIELTGGRVYSHLILSEAIKIGLDRKKSYRNLQKCAFEEGDFLDNVCNNEYFETAFSRELLDFIIKNNDIKFFETNNYLISKLLDIK